MDFLSTTTVDHFVKMLAAILLAFPVGWNREVNSFSAGLRTYPLVALGACAFMLVGMEVISESSDDATSRLIAGLLTGIGFIGGGVILKTADEVKGTATAASIWITGAVGAAVGFGLWDIAVILSVLNVATVLIFSKAKKSLD